MQVCLSESERERYDRHLKLPEYDEKNQQKLKQTSAIVVGTGGLGSPICLYLAAGGIGRLGIVDNDVVALSNLQRQIIHSTPDLNRPKVASAKESLNALNPEVEVETHQLRLTEDNAAEILAGYDVVVDATDNFKTKFLIADTCAALKKPYSHGGVFHYIGQTMTVVPGESACYRCLFTEFPPEEVVERQAGAGIVGAVPGIIGSIQAFEVIKLITGIGQVLTGSLLSFDSRTMQFRKIKLKRNPSCPVCS